MATNPVVTMVEATVSPDRVPDLMEAFPVSSSAELPDYLLGTMLLGETDSDRWRIVTIWRSQNDLEEYLRSVETPAARQAFREVGVEPVLSVWEANPVLLKS